MRRSSRSPNIRKESSRVAYDKDKEIVIFWANVAWTIAGFHAGPLFWSIKLEFVDVGCLGGRNNGYPKKNPRNNVSTNNKTQPTYGTALRSMWLSINWVFFDKNDEWVASERNTEANDFTDLIREMQPGKKTCSLPRQGIDRKRGKWNEATLPGY